MQIGSHTYIMSENFESLVPKHFSTTWFDKQNFLQPILVAAIINVISVMERGFSVGMMSIHPQWLIVRDHGIS